MFELEVKCTFDAAHRVAGYPGKCDRMHGHTWTAAARATGTCLSDIGILMDFKAFSGALKAVTDTLDHRCLNELPCFSGVNPTAENIAKYIYDRLIQDAIFGENDIRLADVTVWESTHSSVRYTGDDA